MTTTTVRTARPAHGRARVREWPDGEWSLPARESEPSRETLLARFERAKEGQQVSEDEHRMRAWLEGRS